MQAPAISPVIWHPPPRSISSFKLTILTQRHQRAPALCCSRPEGQNDLENPQENLGLSSVVTEGKHNDIWRLFREAQQNILFLNKQRLAAVEELGNLKREKDELVDRIVQLEEENQNVIGKDKLSLLWELLLRIDSMVLNGLLNTEEASSMRTLVREHRLGISEVSPDILQKGDSEILAELRLFSDRLKSNGFHIIHICSEMAPLVSVGPLASYVTGLSRALQGKGHLVEVILPKYATLELDEIQGLREVEADLYSYFNGQLHANRIWNGVVCGIGVTLVQPLYYSSFFSRDKVYGYSDDFDRFAYFSRASLDYIVKSGKRPDVLHIHNRETAIVGPLFWDIFVNQGLEGSRILFTCQGFDSEYLVPPDKLALCGLDPAGLHRLDRLQDNIKPQFVNVLKGGIVYSNKVVTMPSSHSKGRIIHSSSHGLEPALAVHKEKLLLAPSFGLDSTTWDPSKDEFLPEKYSVEDIRGKSICKVELQHQLGLVEHISTTVVGCIFTEISDVDLESLKAIVRGSIMTGIQFILMGMNEDQTTIGELEKLQEEFEDGGNLMFVRGHDETLLHLIFAGSDIMLCQSLHDPILQVPFKALRYGTVPIALKTNSSDAFGHLGAHEQETTGLAGFINSTFGDMSLSQALDHIFYR
ncbi:PREDICTED: probable starch synthase 4, chloroplastic/amyloplastic isoform X3 [Tarenaya hassleriana]|uniref:probable starch synthase 4, chloroplastic/amyloplastic isoform X3 n=1 Tax=Tarenaya hassleriana TaxID=28532 RepID=UPI00053C1D5C|nr:PREDICTED: probable starch synthase 4, chloroplastic/amyloplastic isoform X3 [Tarenaya hassleriana]